MPVLVEVVTMSSTTHTGDMRDRLVALGYVRVIPDTSQAVVEYIKLVDVQDADAPTVPRGN